MGVWFLDQMASPAVAVTQGGIGDLVQLLHRSDRFQRFHDGSSTDSLVWGRIFTRDFYDSDDLITVGDWTGNESYWEVPRETCLPLLDLLVRALDLTLTQAMEGSPNPESNPMASDARTRMVQDAIVCMWWSVHHDAHAVSGGVKGPQLRMLVAIPLPKVFGACPCILYDEQLGSSRSTSESGTSYPSP